MGGGRQTADGLFLKVWKARQGTLTQNSISMVVAIAAMEQLDGRGIMRAKATIGLHPWHCAVLAVRFGPCLSSSFLWFIFRIL